MDLPDDATIIKVSLTGYILAKGEDGTKAFSHDFHDTLEELLRSKLDNPVILDYDLDIDMEAAMLKDQITEEMVNMINALTLED